jgi:6-pyruvoyltetrahydropterin/6-carboxytetrahydropterin synthase
MTFRSTKTFGHDLGLSACFRQWKAKSHCRFLHGYALAVRLEFEADALDDRNWVVDFGGMKPLKAMLEATFDHKLLLAKDDPLFDGLHDLAALGVADIVVVDATGCEKFAEMIFDMTEAWLDAAGFAPRCRLVSVEVREHGANSAIFSRPQSTGVEVRFISDEEAQRLLATASQHPLVPGSAA